MPIGYVGKHRFNLIQQCHASPRTLESINFLCHSWSFEICRITVEADISHLFNHQHSAVKFTKSLVFPVGPLNAKIYNMHVPESQREFLGKVQEVLRRYDAQLKDINQKVSYQNSTIWHLSSVG